MPRQPITIGEHLRKRRAELGLTQTEAAARLGVSLFCLWRWEHEKAQPRQEHQEALAAFLGYVL
ncbi:MAG: helix-turn-helix transcriptional regulator [Alphaproteobacteria bacterium]|nr:helix-turn-helix transcriptional regulator [Alphaproteobacteria bacterium]